MQIENGNKELRLLGRKNTVFQRAWQQYDVPEAIREKRILVVGGAGSIGSTVVEILFGSSPAALHVVDVNENALANLVRQLRSSLGYVTEDFRTICFDPLHPRADKLLSEYGPYDIILNFAAIKHVRSEKDPLTLLRMFDVNIRLMKRLTEWADAVNSQTLFSVSTDKAANPANLMGASKRLMEMVGFHYAGDRFNTARFANVAFSNGSLLQAFWDRLDKRQPISAPSNINRFFITHEEAARLCLLEAVSGPKQTVAIPRAPGEIELTSFVDVATSVLATRGYEPLLCGSEEEARSTEPTATKWPCYFFESDTSGEKPFEEFVAEGEERADSPFEEVSLIGRLVMPDPEALAAVLQIDTIAMPKEEVVNRVADVVPGFHHIETGKNLDQRM